MGSRSPLVTSLEEAASWVRDGCTLGIGGFVTTNKPMAFLRELMRRRVRDLTIFAGQASIDVDMLIGLGMVSRVISCYVGAEAASPLLPFYSRLAGKRFQIEEADLGVIVGMLRARIQGIPFMPVVGAAGTSLPDLNPRLKWVEDPYGGPPVVVVPPAEIDVAVIHANQADPYGNVQHLGAVFLDQLLALAGKKVVAVVERLVSNEDIRKSPAETTIPCSVVDAVAVAPYGAYPCASENFYVLDTDHIREYVKAARLYLDGQPEAFDEYVRRYIDGPPTHARFLEMVGFERLFSLALGGA